MSWETLRVAFLRHRERQNLARCTLEIHRRWLANLQAFCQAQPIQPEQFTPDQVRQFRQVLLWRPGRGGRLLAPNSVDQALRVVRAFLRWAHREGFLPLDPTRDLVLPRPAQPARQLFTAAELETVRLRLDLRTPQGLREAALFELLQQLPLPELLSLDLVHVEPIRCAGLRLTAGRSLALSDRAAQALEAYLHNGRPHLSRALAQQALFLNAPGRRMGLERARQRLRALGRTAGLRCMLTPRRLLQSAYALADAVARPRLPFVDD